MLLEWLRSNQFIIGLFGGSVASYVLQSAVSYLKRERNSILYHIESANVVESTDSELSIHFKGRSIQKLDAHNIDISNSGNQPITDLPVIVKTAEGSQILSCDVEVPGGVKYAIEGVSGSEASVKIDLLQKGEGAKISIKVADSKAGSSVDIFARKPKLEIVKRNILEERERAYHKETMKVIGNMFLITATVAVLALLAGLYFVPPHKWKEPLVEQKSMGTPNLPVKPEPTESR